MKKLIDFWAITSYYNPFKGNLRLLNYYNFRKNLDLPLITIEWSPEGKFDLMKKDAEILVQLSGGDILWQKERLLNIALDYLPKESKYVAWLDCDILFENSNWVKLASGLLEDNDVIQLFEKVINLKNTNTKQINLEVAKKLPFEKSVYSGIYAYKNGLSPDDIIFQSNPGLAYAAKTAWLKKNKFYDVTVVGGGDTFFLFALINHIEHILSGPYTQQQKKHYKAWSHKIKSKPKISYLPQKIYHMYHGDSKFRRYSDRHMILTELNFDPLIHLELSDKGIWQWTFEGNNIKHKVYEYMKSRLDS